jgi:hypothetical protein
MGSLASDFSGDQRNALSLASDVSGIPMGGWSAAGALSLGGDSNRVGWQGNANQLAAARAGVGVQRAALDFEKQQYADALPWQQLSAYGSYISGTYDPYSTRHDYGFDGRSQSPSYASPTGQAIAGGLGAYGMAKNAGW